MSGLRERARDFLRRHGMEPADFDLEAGLKEYLEEMRRGLSGEPSSLEMIPTYIELAPSLPVQEPVIAVDAGGTNLRIALVRFDRELRPSLEKYRKVLMPGVEREVGREEFYRAFAAQLRDYLPASRRLGFCFSFSMAQLPNKDGRVNSLGKEVKAPEVLGTLVGESLAAALGEAGQGRPPKIVIVNDTVTAMLAGMAGSAGRGYSGYLGFILGTGTNTCYLEANRNIAKVPGLDPGGQQVINMESGNYNRVPQGTVDREYNAGTRYPEQHLLEKMVSGAYLGPIALATLRRAAEEGLFSAPAAEGLRALEELATEALHEYLSYPQLSSHPLGAAVERGSREDRVILYHLLDRLVERSAKLAALTLSGAVLKCGAGQDPCAPACVVVEGSVYWGLKGMRRKVECYLKGFLEERHGRYLETVQVENASLVGAAIAGLTN
jgi:hexokinase